MAQRLNILIIEDSEADCALLVRMLRQTGYEVSHQRVESAPELEIAMRTRTWDCVISDFSMPGFSGISALQIVRQKDPDVPFIFLSGTIGENVAVEAMRGGAQDYVLKGNMARLLPAIERELRDAQTRREHRSSEQKVRQLEKFEAIGKLAGGIAHDFNNVIGAILGWAELGEEEASEGGRAHKFFVQIRQQAERAASLTQQLLAYARRQVLAPRSINLNHIVSEATALLQRLIGEQIDLQTALAPDLRSTRADPAQVEQVLLNLCLNARDAMAGGGRLLIETHNTDLDEAYCRRNDSLSPGAYVQLTVSDSGTGMDAATLGHIFEPFFTTKEQGKGTGLGLATAFGIVKQHLGHIEVCSEIGKGSAFHIYLPAIQDSAEEIKENEKEMVRGGSETILLAEDHEGLREMALHVLTGLGYSIVVARDGCEAVENFQKNPRKFALLLLDVVMPQLGGPDAFDQIRKIDASMPVIFTSGYSEESETLRAALTHPRTRLLQKPFLSKDLARLIREILDGGEETSGSVAPTSDTRDFL